MDNTVVEKSIEDMKAKKRSQSAIVTRRWREAQDQLDELAKEEGKVYINGKSEEVRQHCISTKDKVKIKEA